MDCLDMAGAVRAIERMVEEGRETRLVATVNPEFVMRARVDPRFGAVLESADLCLADGIGVVWAMRRQGCTQYERVPAATWYPCWRSAAPAAAGDPSCSARGLASRSLRRAAWRPSTRGSGWRGPTPARRGPRTTPTRSGASTMPGPTSCW